MIKIAVGDVIYLRKIHPCGSSSWNVYRVGADIGIRCTKCKRRTLMERRDLLKRIKPDNGIKEIH